MSEPRDGTAVIHLRPLPRLRVTGAIGSLLILGVGVFAAWEGLAIGVWSHNGWVISALGAAFGLTGLVLLVGTFRIEVVLRPDEAVVVGYLATRRIPRAWVRSITYYPSIVWVDPTGRTRRTRVDALSLYRLGATGPNAKVVARVDAEVARLTRWAGVPGPGAPVTRGRAG